MDGDDDDNSNISKAIRRLIDAYDVEDLFDGPCAIGKTARPHSQPQFKAIGPIAGVLVVVYFTKAKGRSRPLKALKANCHEKRLYDAYKAKWEGEKHE